MKPRRKLQPMTRNCWWGAASERRAVSPKYRHARAQSLETSGARECRANHPSFRGWRLARIRLERKRKETYRQTNFSSQRLRPSLRQDDAIIHRIDKARKPVGVVVASRQRLELCFRGRSSGGCANAPAFGTNRHRLGGGER